MKLHIGGQVAIEGWTVLDIEPRECVDIVCDCRQIEGVDKGTCETIYASHVIEHLSYRNELIPTLKAWRELLTPAGELWLSVPNMDTLCRLWTHYAANPDRQCQLMRIIYGGQTSRYDQHKAGFNWHLLCSALQAAGYTTAKLVDGFGIDCDCSVTTFGDEPISLNVVASCA